jgi:hypothetical protein
VTTLEHVYRLVQRIRIDRRLWWLYPKTLGDIIVEYEKTDEVSMEWIHVPCELSQWLFGKSNIKDDELEPSARFLPGVLIRTLSSMPETRSPKGTVESLRRLTLTTALCFIVAIVLDLLIRSRKSPDVISEFRRPA